MANEEARGGLVRGDLVSARHHRREVAADGTELRWTDRDVLALLRAATAPAFALDRVHGMIRESRREPAAIDALGEDDRG